MMERLQQAVNLIRKLGYDAIAERLAREKEALSAESYRIAVVGEFKTGKSTLINRVFLKEDLLFTDIMEATAVVTEIRYGPEKRLEVIPYATRAADSSDIFEEKAASGPQISPGLTWRIGEGEPIRIDNPSPEQIRSHTSAETAEGRTRLARDTARVRLVWPADGLDGLTLFDTPGINTLNAAVIAATYRIIPEADLVIFVTAAKGLSSVELEFLSSRVFSQGITRAVAVVTYDPRTHELTELERERLHTHIVHQLASLGRESVPVEMVDIRRRRTAEPDRTMGFKARVEKSAGPARPTLDQSRQKAGDVIRDLLGDRLSEPEEKEGAAADSPPASFFPESADAGFAGLETRLIDFIRRNVRPARVEKASHVRQQQVRLALARCSGELSALEKSESDRSRLRNEVRAKEAEMRLAHERLANEFKEELRRVQNAFLRNVDGELRRIGQEYAAGFEACEGLEELQSRLENGRRVLGRELEAVFIRRETAVQEEIRELVRRYGVKSQLILNPWQSEMSRELHIDAGVLSRIPPFAVLAVDILLFARFGPFGPLADILIRILAQYIPYLNRLLPVAMAGAVLRRKIKDALTTQFEKLREELPDMIEGRFQEITERLMTEWNDYLEGQLAVVRGSVEKAAPGPADAERKALLRETRARLEGMLGERLE